MMVNLNFEDDRNISSICISGGIYAYTIIITERKLTAVARKLKRDLFFQSPVSLVAQWWLPESPY